MILDQLKSHRIILASQSPRRRELMEKMGITFTSISLDIDEEIDLASDPVEAAENLSYRKAVAFPKDKFDEDVIVITADTVVALGNTILGKPNDTDDALNMLKQLSGREHTVVTGVSIRDKNRIISFSAVSKVRFAVLSEQEMMHYVRNFKPFDKAGSYGIQEWIGFIGIEHLEGSYFNVMGLPTHLLYHQLGDFISHANPAI